MKLRLFVSLICAVSLCAAGGARAALPSHYGNANPLTEGFTSEGQAAYGSAGADGWVITDPGVSYLLYIGNYGSDDLPENWKLNWTMKMNSASMPWRPVVAIGDGSKFFQYHFSIAEDGVGTMYRLAQSAIVPIATFVNGNTFHNWSAARVGGNVNIYLDGALLASTDYESYYNYSNPTCYFGTANAGQANTTEWSLFNVMAVPEPGAFLALGSGLLGFVGFAVRRKK